METLVLRPVCKSAMLADLVSLKSNAISHLVVIEHTYKMVASSVERPTEETRWGLWTQETQNAAFHKKIDSSLVLPVASALAVGCAKEDLVILAEANKSVGAYMMRMPLRDGASTLPANGVPKVQPIQLPLAETGKVRLDPRETWNTTTLPCEEWLFNPYILTVEENGDRYFALNTADAQCILFRSSRDAEASKVFAFVPGFLEPSVQKLGKRMLLFGRQPRLPWSVFFHSTRHSGQYGPVALPLRLAELDAEGKETNSKDISELQHIGEPFIYAVASGGPQDLVLAVVVGSKAVPKLQLYYSRDAAERFSLIGEAALTAIPRRLTVSLSLKSALVGLAFRVVDGDEIQAQSIMLAP